MNASLPDTMKGSPANLRTVAYSVVAGNELRTGKGEPNRVVLKNRSTVTGLR
jgi:hypothetical protein